LRISRIAGRAGVRGPPLPTAFFILPAKGLTFNLKRKEKTQKIN